MIWSYPCSGSFSTTPSSTSLELEGQLRIVKASVQYLVRVVREVRGEWQQCVPYDITDDRDNLNQEEKTQSRSGHPRPAARIKDRIYRSSTDWEDERNMGTGEEITAAEREVNDMLEVIIMTGTKCG